MTAVSYAREEKAVTKVGWIAHTMCKDKITKSEHKKSCSLKCAKMHDAKLAFYDNDSKEWFEIDAQEKAKDFCGKKVELKGIFDSEKKKVTVNDIKGLESQEVAEK